MRGGPTGKCTTGCVRPAEAGECPTSQACATVAATPIWGNDKEEKQREVTHRERKRTKGHHQEQTDNDRDQKQRSNNKEWALVNSSIPQMHMRKTTDTQRRERNTNTPNPHTQLEIVLKIVQISMPNNRAYFRSSHSPKHAAACFGFCPGWSLGCCIKDIQTESDV